jgi:mannose/fructose-specific phosphotransferase system component IIA
MATGADYGRGAGNGMVGGILIGHGTFACGLRSALELILGEVDHFEAISTEGLARVEIERQISEAVARFRGMPVLIFTDLQGGCATNICSSLFRTAGGAGIVCGANLPMLIKFVQYRARVPAVEVADMVVRAGIDGIRSVGAPEPEAGARPDSDRQARADA